MINIPRIPPNCQNSQNFVHSFRKILSPAKLQKFSQKRRICNKTSLFPALLSKLPKFCLTGRAIENNSKSNPTVEIYFEMPRNSPFSRPIVKTSKISFNINISLSPSNYPSIKPSSIIHVIFHVVTVLVVGSAPILIPANGPRIHHWVNTSRGL